MIGAEAHTLKAFLLSKATHFFIIFGYLWLLLSVYALHNSIVLSDWRLIGHLFPAMLKALIFTKFLLIGEHLKLGDWFEGKPLIWPVLVKAALFAILLIGFDVLEVMAVNAFRHHASAESGNVELTNFRASLSFAFMAFIALIPFFGIRELAKVIGEDRLRDLFFHNTKKLKES